MMKFEFNIKRITPLIIYGLYFILIGMVVYCLDYYSKPEITDILKNWTVWNFRINLLVILGGILFAAASFSKPIKRLWSRRGVMLAAFLVFSFLVVCFVAPRVHRIYYDEDIYANIGQNIALTDQNGVSDYSSFDYDEYTTHWLRYNKHPSGWPFLISIVFQLLGTNELYVFLLNNFIFVAGLLVVFFIAKNLDDEDLTGIFSLLILAFIPHNLIWSNTGAAEPAAALFAGLTVLFFVLYIRSSRLSFLFLLAAIIPMACQMRPESILIIPWLFLAILIMQPRMFISEKFWWFGLVTLLFLVPHFLHLYAVSGEAWGAKAARFSMEFLKGNLGVNGPYFLNNKEFPVVFTLFAIIGLVAGNVLWRWRLLILAWFLVFWGIFLLFYAGSYHYGADVRFSLLVFIPLAILAGLGAKTCYNILGNFFAKRALPDFLAGGIILLLLISLPIGFLPRVRTVGQEAWGARYDHLYAGQFIEKIPKRSLILTHNPTMFLLWGQSAIQTYAGVNNPELISSLLEKYKGAVYFHYNFWCNTDTDQNTLLCQAMFENYELTKVTSAEEQNYEYALYKMSKKE